MTRARRGCSGGRNEVSGDAGRRMGLTNLERRSSEKEAGVGEILAELPDRLRVLVLEALTLIQDEDSTSKSLEKWTISNRKLV